MNVNVEDWEKTVRSAHAVDSSAVDKASLRWMALAKLTITY
jgi:hypothetical protein